MEGNKGYKLFKMVAMIGSLYFNDQERFRIRTQKWMNARKLILNQINFLFAQPLPMHRLLFYTH